MAFDKNDLIVKHRIESDYDNKGGTVEILVENRSSISIDQITVFYNVLNKNNVVEHKREMQTKNISPGERRIILSQHIHASSSYEHSNKVKITDISGTASDGTIFNIAPPDTFTYNRCFVTTAAYGNDYHPMVVTFRSLRDEVLIDHKYGRMFINWYNRKGPELADLIIDKPILRAGARAVLTPLALVVIAVRSLGKYFS